MSKFTKVGTVKNITGSIICPEFSGLKIVIGDCNVSGKVNNRIFDLTAKRWKKVSETYYDWFVNSKYFVGGGFTTALVQSDVWVGLLLCKDAENNLNQKWLDDSLKKLMDCVKYEKASIHVDKVIADDLGLETKIQDILDQGISVFIYS